MMRSLSALTVALVMASAGPARGQTFTVLHAFTGKADGGYPYGGLGIDQGGNLYGATNAGGRYKYGVIYKIDATGAFTGLHQLTFHEGCYPEGSLLSDSGGNVYGTTMQCGSSHVGTVFELTSSGKMIVLHAFTGADGGQTYAGLIRDWAGNLYGAATGGGPGGNGTVFKLDRRTGAETVLHGFEGPPDGALPSGTLAIDTESSVYGTTAQGGAFGNPGEGTVFKVDSTGTESILWSFGNGTDGRNPSGGVIRDAVGNLYGTTSGGGSGCGGTVFKLDLNGTETILHCFTGNPDGQLPVAGVIGDSAGNLYGTTEGGGLFNVGTVYQLAPDGTIKILHSFTDGSDGASPFAGLVQDAAGNLYGTTPFGGDPACSCGVVFEITP